MKLFIPIDKMRKLREASKTGDEQAKKILSMHLGGKEDYSSLMDEYFAPKVEEVVPEAKAIEEKPAVENEGLKEFLKFNGIEEGHPEYDSYVEDYYKENPDQKPIEETPTQECEEENGCKCLLEKLMKEETEAMDSYSKKITMIMNDSNISGNKKRKILARLEEIRSDEQEHFSELSKLIAICDSQEEITEE